MHSTSNDLPLATRKKVIGMLADRLADAIDLRSQVKHAHWSVRGPGFIALHELFDKVVDVVDEQADDIAERIAQLGGGGPEIRGTIRQAAKGSSLPEYPLKATSPAEHVQAVSAALAAFGGSLRTAIEHADKAGDKGTSDLFTQASRAIDKSLWLVEANG